MCTRLVLRLLAAGCGTVCLTASHLSAQAPSPAPTFQFLRWQEDWSAWSPPAGPTSGFDALKHVTLKSGDWLSFGADFRARAESWRNFNFGAPAGISHDDTFILTRWRAHADYHATTGLRAFAELKGAYASERDLPGGIRPIDQDKFELQQAFLEFDLPFAPSVRARAGRQLFAFGAQRLISGLPWANALRTWDGLRLDTSVAGWQISGFGAAFVPSTARGIGTAADDNRLFGVYASRPGLDAYVLHHQWPSRTFNGSTGRDARWTLGTRLHGRVSARTDYELELSYQTGSVGPHDVTAWSIASQIGLRPLAEADTLRLWVGFDAASGDDRPGGRVGTFNQLYPLGHAYFGIADVIGRQNIIDLSAGATWKPFPRLTLNAAWHHFRTQDTADALYNPGGGVVRAAGTYTDPEIADELDLVAAWKINRHVVAALGWAHVFAGPAIRQSGPAQDIDFAYATTTWTF
ncbi:alginate export family protein [Actomonas aquatica]|uniref:Alginate export family protein n=1 Tax=Actomonas aquatica TaxID=2866162 RepID=A0ABZ1CAR5_9BACT|nr:alginate export family protein [Opitutus sp. WL0086]WRQ88768.1 alginate export family protein [Opitutus sp. WL0086]